MHTLQPMPDDLKEQIVFKPAFEERYKQLLGDRYDEFIEYSLSWLRKAIRVNTLKTSVDEVKRRLEPEWILDAVPWCSEAFWIEHKGDEEGNKRRDIGNIPEHTLGYFYVQEPASMLPPVVLQPTNNSSILDMCAAPGSKTSQLSAMVDDTGIIVANEMTMSRLAALKVNLQRCGASNTMITQMDGRRLSGTYDYILVDAPCSGTGTIRKSLKTISMWNPKMVQRLGKIQLALLRKAYELLAPGGRVVYSTCTLEPEENEAVIHNFLLNQSDALVEDIDLPIVRSEAITSFNGTEYTNEVKKCLRIYPMDNDSEGFFVCSIKKPMQ